MPLLTAAQAVEDCRPLGEQGGVQREVGRWQGQAVFVKTLRVDDPEVRRRFLHEGRVAEALAHPLIVPLLARTPTQLIFPYVPGGTLRERLSGGPLPAGPATEVVLGLLDAVAYLHAQGVTHHDLKPENVLLASGVPSRAAVRIIDFGMSHAPAHGPDIHSGTRMGTPHFMAPEQFQGVRGDPRSDLYSLGAVWFDLLAGVPPYEDALGWLSGGAPPPTPLPGPPALHSALVAALERDPERRPADAPAMRAAVEAARAGLDGAPAAGGVPCP